MGTTPSLPPDEEKYVVEVGRRLTEEPYCYTDHVYPWSTVFYGAPDTSQPAPPINGHPTRWVTRTIHYGPWKEAPQVQCDDLCEPTLQTRLEKVRDMSRPPAEILKVVDQAQQKLGDEFDLRSLLWEVIDDVSSSYELALLPLIGENLTVEVNNQVGDYLAKEYGD